MAKNKYAENIDPYKFQSDDNAWYKREKDGTYVYIRSIVVELKVKPRIQNGKENAGCCGNSWTLSEDGKLLMYKGYRHNGPNFVDDAACRMLAAGIHDALCSPEAEGAYSYWQLQKFYSDICEAQGEKKWFAKTQFVGLLMFYWLKRSAEKFYRTKRHHVRCGGCCK